MYMFMYMYVHMSYVICHVSCVTCRMSHVICICKCMQSSELILATAGLALAREARPRCLWCCALALRTTAVWPAPQWPHVIWGFDYDFMDYNFRKTFDYKKTQNTKYIAIGVKLQCLFNNHRVVEIIVGEIIVKSPYNNCELTGIQTGPTGPTGPTI